jgi:catalase
MLELNRNPNNVFAEVEQAAFNPANIVPGIGFSPTRCCRAACSPTATPSATGWGSTINHIPVNAPKCPFHSYHRDGQMRTDGNAGRRRPSATEPNSKGAWIDQPELNEPPLALDGAAAIGISARTMTTIIPSLVRCSN